MNRICLKLIRFYQKYLSPTIFAGAHCRFQPTCSEYARQAFEKYSFSKAPILTIKRILKCHPFHPGGYDPLP